MACMAIVRNWLAQVIHTLTCTASTDSTASAAVIVPALFSGAVGNAWAGNALIVLAIFAGGAGAAATAAAV
ncbi:MAG: hypothetical protein ABIH78_05100, partial [Candidatus Peregrinibacteria bacterium]